MQTSAAGIVRGDVVGISAGVGGGATATRTDVAHGSEDEVRLHLLGDFQLECGNQTAELPASCQRLVAFLALNTNFTQRAYLASRLWFNRSEGKADASLRSALWRLRGRVGARLVVATRTHLQLDRAVKVDAHEYVFTARRFLRTRDGAADIDFRQFLDDAELLPGWYDEWVVSEREHLRQLRLHALESVAERLLSERRWAEAIDVSLVAAQADPLRESAQQALIQAYLGERNYCEANRAYHRFERTVATKLGMTPSPELAMLVARDTASV